MRAYLGTRLGKKVYVGVSQSVSGNKKKEEMTGGQLFVHNFVKTFAIGMIVASTVLSALFKLLPKNGRRRRW